MTKLDIDEITRIIKGVKLPPEAEQKVLKEVKDTIQKIEDHKDDTAAGPKQKNEYGVVLFDAENKLAGQEFTACVFKIPEGDDMGTVLTRLSTASRTQNDAAKRKKNPIKSMGEAFGFLKRKFSKTVNIQPVTKIPVRVLISNNELV